MTTAAEQYRRLVAKLEAINPSEPVSEGGYAPATPAAAPQDDATGVDAAAAIQAASAAPAPATTNEIPTLPGTFKQAYAQAVKQGLKQFKWTGTYSTRRGQGPNPAPAPAPARRGIQPAVGVTPIQPSSTFSQDQADALNLAAAGGMGA
jgi:hypothetical protein